MTDRALRYAELLERARAAAGERAPRSPAQALRRALLRDPRRLIDDVDRRPRFVVWELTRACNLRCRHCGSAAGQRLADELSPEEALAVADQLVELGCERLTLLGGEPLLREDWPGLCARLRAGGVRVNMISNGWLLDRPAVLDLLLSSGLANLGLSVDGLEETHDQLRRRRGSFRRLLAAASELRRRGLAVAAVTVVTRQSLGELEALHDELVEAGVRLWQVQLGVPRGRLEAERGRVLRPQELPDLARRLAGLRARRELRLDVSDNIGYFGGFEERLRRTADDQIPFWSGCYAGVQVLGIDPNGDVKGCASLPSSPQLVEGNLRRERLRQIWERPGAFAYNRCFELSQLEEPCRSCEHAPVCRGGCKSAALGFTGSLAHTTMCLEQQRRGEPERG